MKESPSNIRFDDVVIQQPGRASPQEGVFTVGHNLMLVPFQRIPNCPPGLEYLTMIDQLLVHQKVDLLEVLTGYVTQNQYTVKNALGQIIFTAKESSSCCDRQLCFNLRPFDLKICDNLGVEVIHLYRPLNCTGCFFPCCLQKLEVSSPPGTLIGFIQEEWSIFTHKYSLLNASGNIVLCIEKHTCTCHCNCCSDIDYEVLTPDSEKQVGKITKQWGGLLKEAFTNADNFSVTFPMDLDVKMKAVMLSACIFIDFLHFEKKMDMKKYIKMSHN